MSYFENVYANPDKHGLEIVGEIDWSSGMYEFDKTVIWKDQNNQLYFGEDSGCSCPSPFEDCEGIDDLEKITFHELASHLKERFHNGDGRYGGITDGSIVDLLSRIRNLGSTW